MNSDHYFYIGKSHKVCQDYSLSGEKDGVHYAIVCDGCSGSPDTDIGARLLARAALSCIDKIHYDSLFHEMVISKAAMQAKALELHPRALDSTLLIAVHHKNQFYIKMYGDGCIAIKKKDGSLDIHEAEFPGNAPYYLNYLVRNSMYEEEYKAYIGKFLYTEMISILDLEKRFVQEQYAPEKPSSIWKDLGYPSNDVQFVALMSDGVKSFESKSITQGIESTHYLDVITELTAFKNFKGEFVKRRASAALKKYYSNNIFHKDDISIAVVLNDEVNS